MKPRSLGYSGTAIAALIAAQLAFVAAYIAHEHTIYYWDHAMYFNMARQAYDAFGRDFASGWALFGQSLANNYNFIFALPSFVTFSLFGETRLVFSLTNFVVFFLAYEIAAAFLLKGALKWDWAFALIASLAANMLIPPLWLPLLEGYPDNGAAACLVLAAALSFDKTRQARPITNALMTGIALGFAVLLRRHFVYPAIALWLVLGCLAALDLWHSKKNRARQLRETALYFIVCGLGFIGIVAFIAPAFVRDALTTNYRALYISYQRPVGVFLRFVLGGFGYGLLLVAASGLFMLAQTGRKEQRFALFIALYTSLWLIVWCGGPDQMGHHYILHALPLFVAAGIAGWIVYLAKQKQERVWAIGAALGVFLAANSAWALWFSPTGVWPNDNGTPGLLSAARPPVVRADYGEWLRLANYLKKTTRPEDRIMMIGSSFVFNQDLMRGVYADILNAPEMTYRFLRAPEIDHEEPAPLNAFIAANVYLVPKPAQYHLDPAGQRVITAAANQIPPPPARLAMFHTDDAVFHLEDGVDVRIWRRDAWTPADLHAALTEIRRDGPQDVNFVQDWVTMTMPLEADIRTDARNHTFVTALLGPDHKDIRLFFDYSLAHGKQQLGLTLASDCGPLKTGLTVVTGEDYHELSEKLTPAASSAIAESFAVPATPDQSHFLELDVSGAPAAPCHVVMRDLRVETLP